MFWVETIPAAIFLICLFIIPESLRFLIAKGKDDQAIAVLTGLTGAKLAAEQAADIKSTIDAGHKHRLSDLLNKVTGRLHPVVVAGFFIAILQQFTGINVVMYYGSTLWQAAGFVESDSLLINFISGCVNVGFTFVAIALIDKIGRRPLLLIGAGGQAIMLGIMALIFYNAPLDSAGHLGLGMSYMLYAICGLIAWFFVRYFVQETCGKTLEEISRRPVKG